jgi:hypothetical protein
MFRYPRVGPTHSSETHILLGRTHVTKKQMAVDGCEVLLLAVNILT